MTHGWPGSVIELLETVGPLTDPTAHGGSAEDAFDLVLPSLPGYGFSGEPAELGWDAGRTARAWAELMHRLGYTRYVAQGGDVGALVTDLMGRQAVEGLVGYHLNLLTAVLAIGDQLPKESEQERAAAEAFATFRQDGFGYFLEMATRPQTIGYALLDSPVALAAWLLDHDTDSYYKISRAFVDGEPVGNLTRDTIVDNITLYWLTGTAASAARSYWEDGRALAAAVASGQPPPAVTCRSASRPSPARSGLPRAAGSRRSTPTSPTSTRSTRAATSPRGKSPSSLPPRCGLHSAHCANETDVSLFGARRHPRTAPLPVEGHLPGFDGATGWLNSSPLTLRRELPGRSFSSISGRTPASTGSAHLLSCARGPRKCATSASPSSASILLSSRSNARLTTSARPRRT